MKKIFLLLTLLCVVAAGGVSLPVLAAGEHDPIFQVEFSSAPRFPIVGQEAELTFKISSMDGNPLAGQSVMIMIEKKDTAGHGHEEDGEHEDEEAPAGGHDMANMGGGEEEPPPMIHLVPDEVSPGVYAGEVTFEQGGRYIATVNVMGEEVDVVIGVRSSPVAWWFVGGLAGLVTLLAGTVAVTKTVRRTW